MRLTWDEGTRCLLGPVLRPPCLSVEAGLLYFNLIKSKVLMDLNIVPKVTSGGWNMRKDSVTIVRKRLERCVCEFCNVNDLTTKDVFVL